MLWLEILGPILGYVGVGGYAYRRRYISTYKAWRKWQAEAPNKPTTLSDSYSFRQIPRKDVSHWRFIWDCQNHTPPLLLGSLWPFYWVTKSTRAILHPEVKVPDYVAIKELEKGQDDQHTCTGTCLC